MLQSIQCGIISSLQYVKDTLEDRDADLKKRKRYFAKGEFSLELPKSEEPKEDIIKNDDASEVENQNPLEFESAGDSSTSQSEGQENADAAKRQSACKATPSH